MPPTADNAVRRFQTYLSCQAVTDLRIFPVAQEKGEKFEAQAVLAGQAIAECEVRNAE